MTKKQIFESGFIEAFIKEYFEYKFHIYYPDKDRLKYSLCIDDKEKKEITKEQIHKLKTKIEKLGFPELASAYLTSCKPENGVNYIESNERFDFWLKRFVTVFDENISAFDEVKLDVLHFCDLAELEPKVFDEEDEFWEFYPKEDMPEIQDLVYNIPTEHEIIQLIDEYIEENEINGGWEFVSFDFEKFETFKSYSKPIEILLNLSELLVQLKRYEMFKEFIEIENKTLNQNQIPQQSKKQKSQPKENAFKFTNNFDDVSESDVYNYFEEKLVNKKLLSEEVLQSYLISAFQEKKPPEKPFEMNLEITKSRIYNIFYTYYKDKAHKPHGKQTEYVNLLSKYFKGFKHNSIASNWSK